MLINGDFWLYGFYFNNSLAYIDFDCKFLKFRYKISAALSEAGLATTSYAKQLMKGVEGNLKPRRDMMGQL